MSKTKNLVLEILKEGEMESEAILKRLRKMGHDITYDTLAKNLKSMHNEGALTREGRGNKDVDYGNGVKHWCYYYRLNPNRLK